MKVTAAFAVLFLPLIAVSTLKAQQIPAAPATQPQGPLQPPAQIAEVRIDQDCRVLTQPAPTASNPNPAPRYHYDNIVCRIQSQNCSEHWEKTTQNGTPKNIHVTVKEREYVLQNTGATPVSFAVDQQLPKNWRIDSDPQPDQLNGNIATFHVVAEPGQTVRLHVGERGSSSGCPIRDHLRAFSYF